MNEESMARLGLAAWLAGFGWPIEMAAAAAFSRDPDLLKALNEADA